MSARLRGRGNTVFAFACVALAVFAPRARAGDAPADTTVEGYVRAMSDSTDQYFGLSAQPSDTTGIDSVRAWAFAHPGKSTRKGSLNVGLAPLLDFNRVLGGALGGEIGVGPETGLGRLSASAQWTTGADTWFGGGEYAKKWMVLGQDELGTWLSLRAGREWEGLDRDYRDPLLNSLRAFVYGSDRTDYLRRDGARGTWVRRGAGGWVGVGGRDQIESPLVTTATWTLFRRTPDVIGNEAARAVRVHEVDVQAGAPLALLPLTLQGHVWSAGGALGGDAAYTRLRAAAGGAFALGRHLAFAPEVEYGRLTGSALPQEALYLGGNTLRSLNAETLRGTGRMLAHADFIVTDALQKLLGESDTPVFPIQVGAFAGAGAVWGADSLGAAALTKRDWPLRREWLSEAGLSLMYRPGFPHPDSFVRFDYAIPIGADDRKPRLFISYTRSLNFLQQ